MTKSYKEIYEEIKNSPQFKRNSYARRQMGLYFLVSIAALMPIAFIIEELFGVSGYVTCSIAGVIAVVLSVLISEKKINEKFER